MDISLFNLQCVTCEKHVLLFYRDLFTKEVGHSSGKQGSLIRKSPCTLVVCTLEDCTLVDPLLLYSVYFILKENKCIFCIR